MAKGRTPVTIPEAYREALRNAKRETEEALAANPSRSNTDPTLPIFQFAARNNLIAERARFESGDKNALLAAVRICASHKLIMPEWLANAFISAHDEVLNLQVKSWDEAFGQPFPKGKHLNAARKQRNKGPDVWLEVRRQNGAGCAIDENLFEVVGKKMGLGKTLASELYYEHDAKWELPGRYAEVILESYRKTDLAAVPEKRKTLRKETPRR